jgi:hypothetical protein
MQVTTFLQIALHVWLALILSPTVRSAIVPNFALNAMTEQVSKLLENANYVMK